MGGSLFPTVQPVNMHQATLVTYHFLQCGKTCEIAEMNPTTPYLLVTIKKSFFLNAKYALNIHQFLCCQLHKLKNDIQKF
jgi:hypothetical protein